MRNGGLALDQSTRNHLAHSAESDIASWQCQCERTRRGLHTTGAHGQRLRRCERCMGGARCARRLGCGTILKRLFNITLDDAPSWTRALNRLNRETVIFGHTSRNGTRAHARTIAIDRVFCGKSFHSVTSLGLRHCGCGRADGTRGVVAGLRCRGRRCRRLCRCCGLGRIRERFHRREIFSLKRYQRDQRSHLHLTTSLHHDRGHAAIVEALHFHRGLVGLDVRNDRARLDGVAFFHIPLDDSACFHRVGQARHGDFNRHW